MKATAKMFQVHYTLAELLAVPVAGDHWHDYDESGVDAVPFRDELVENARGKVPPEYKDVVHRIDMENDAIVVSFARIVWPDEEGVAEDYETKVVEQDVRYQLHQLLEVVVRGEPDGTIEEHLVNHARRIALSIPERCDLYEISMDGVEIVVTFVWVEREGGDADQ